MIANILWRYSLLIRYFYLIYYLKNWKKTIVNERSKLIGEHLMVLRDKTNFISAGSAKIVNDIFIETIARKCYSKHLPKNASLVVDIGAHFGFFSIQVAKLFPNATVLSFEPAPKTNKLLMANIKKNNITNVIVKQVAVGGYNGLIRFTEMDQHESSSIYIANNNSENSIIVPIIKISEVDECKSLGLIDFLKIDCEGAEFDILKEDIDFIKDNVKIIVGEYHLSLRDDKDLYTDLLNPLKENDFKVNHKIINKNLGYFYALNSKFT